MQHAISVLEAALDNHRTNESIHRAEGRDQEASVTQATGNEIAKALSVLRGHENPPAKDAVTTADLPEEPLSEAKQ